MITTTTAPLSFPKQMGIILFQFVGNKAISSQWFVYCLDSALSFFKVSD